MLFLKYFFRKQKEGMQAKNTFAMSILQLLQKAFPLLTAGIATLQNASALLPAGIVNLQNAFPLLMARFVNLQRASSLLPVGIAKENATS